jgi:CheY-like chemotaxis protein
MSEPGPATIVMIEDDAGHARLIEKNIRRAGIGNTIKPFMTGEAALEFLLGDDGSGAGHRGETLLVLLDLNLPDMSGIDILHKIKQSDDLRLTPVVVLTTTDDRREIERCYDLGCNIYITKPVNYEQFAQAIQQLGQVFNVMQVPENGRH